MILAFVSFVAGLILDTVTLGRREMKRLHYLALQGPTFRERRRGSERADAACCTDCRQDCATSPQSAPSASSIDAGLLSALTHLAGWSPWAARVPSFAAAVLATWLLNRRLTFAGRGLQRRSMEAIGYGAIQACGAGINLAGLRRRAWRRSRGSPRCRVIPFAVGSRQSRWSSTTWRWSACCTPASAREEQQS